MTVQQLMQHLGNLPTNAEVRFKNMEVDKTESISKVVLEDRGERCVPSYRYVVTLE